MVELDPIQILRRVIQFHPCIQLIVILLHVVSFPLCQNVIFLFMELWTFELYLIEVNNLDRALFPRILYIYFFLLTQILYILIKLKREYGTTISYNVNSDDIFTKVVNSPPLNVKNLLLWPSPLFPFSFRKQSNDELTCPILIFPCFQLF